MKEIFVTVEEFRSNGGVLEKGRSIYDDELDEDSKGVFECDYGKQKIICYFGGVVAELHQECAFVKIFCQPFYN